MFYKKKVRFNTCEAFYEVDTLDWTVNQSKCEKIIPIKRQDSNE